MSVCELDHRNPGIVNRLPRIFKFHLSFHGIYMQFVEFLISIWWWLDWRCVIEHFVCALLNSDTQTHYLSPRWNDSDINALARALALTDTHSAFNTKKPLSKLSRLRLLISNLIDYFNFFCSFRFTFKSNATICFCLFAELFVRTLSVYPQLNLFHHMRCERFDVVYEFNCSARYRPKCVRVLMIHRIPCCTFYQ